jgi:hypothetical protein
MPSRKPAAQKRSTKVRGRRSKAALGPAGSDYDNGGVSDIRARASRVFGDDAPIQRNDLQQARREYERARQIYQEKIDDGQEVARHYNAIMGLYAGQNFILTKYTLLESISPHVRAIMAAKSVILGGGVALSKQTQAYKDLRTGLETTEKTYVEKAVAYEKELSKLEDDDKQAQREIDRIEKDKTKLEEDRKKADDFIQSVGKWLADLFKQKQDGKVTAQAYSTKAREYEVKAAQFKATSAQLGKNIATLSTQQQRHVDARNQYRGRAQAITGRRLTSIPTVAQMATHVAQAMRSHQQQEQALWDAYVKAAGAVFGQRPLDLRRVPLPSPAQLKPHIEHISGLVSNHILTQLRTIPRK